METKVIWPRLKVFCFSEGDSTGHSERKRGGQKKKWRDTIKNWPGMNFASSTRIAENRTR